MKYPIVIPDLQTGDESLVISGWLVDEGDLVAVGDQIAEILIPGITFDLIAESSGRLMRIEKSVDSKISPGDVIGWLDDASLLDDAPFDVSLD